MHRTISSNFISAKHVQSIHTHNQLRPWVKHTHTHTHTQTEDVAPIIKVQCTLHSTLGCSAAMHESVHESAFTSKGICAAEVDLNGKVPHKLFVWTASPSGLCDALGEPLCVDMHTQLK